MGDLWRNKTFMLVTTSDVMQQIAIWIRNMALLFFVMEITNNDPVSVSLLTVAEYAPIFIFSFVGGVFADRWNSPKRTMIWGDILSFASILVIIFLIWNGLWMAVFFATFVSAVVSQFSQPSSAKIFKKHIPEQHVPTAIAISQSMMSLFIIIGPIIGTIIYTQVGMYPSLISLCVLFLLSAIILSFLPKDEKGTVETDATFFEEMKQGWKYVYRQAVLRNLAITYVFVGLAVGLTQPLEVFLVTNRLGLSKEYVQYLTAVGGIGILVGGIVAAMVSQRLKSKTVLFAGLLFLSVSFVVEVWSTTFWLTATMRFIGGMMTAAIGMITTTLFIKLVDSELVGRVNGTIVPMFMGTMLLGSSLAGILMETISLWGVFILAASIMLVAVIFSTRVVEETKQEKVAPSL
ncbi:MFS transporter [Priestia taiwanensis]|uniref:MFS transporter n=1 Tax=Priestia taiwanensis TaxID=1347902 RepID=A0A917AVV4_9BACI|nr:MFS transporter [Priestia taiwanensis]MBM7363371.1 putative MFS family arabinose efflux permease [Priestia taiwanensis]GGE77711.1 MFS transporter [Priestia taiwanensis]